MCTQAVTMLYAVDLRHQAAVGRTERRPAVEATTGTISTPAAIGDLDQSATGGAAVEGRRSRRRRRTRRPHVLGGEATGTAAGWEHLVLEAPRGLLRHELEIVILQHGHEISHHEHAEIEAGDRREDDVGSGLVEAAVAAEVAVANVCGTYSNLTYSNLKRSR